MPWTWEEKYFVSLLIWKQNHQNCLKIEATHLYDNDLSLRKQTKKKRLYVLKADIIT